MKKVQSHYQNASTGSITLTPQPYNGTIGIHSLAKRLSTKVHSLATNPYTTTQSSEENNTVDSGRWYEQGIDVERENKEMRKEIESLKKMLMLQSKLKGQPPYPARLLEGPSTIQSNRRKNESNLGDGSSHKPYQTFNENASDPEPKAYSSSHRSSQGNNSQTDLMHLQYLREKPLLEEIRILRLAQKEAHGMMSVENICLKGAARSRSRSVKKASSTERKYAPYPLQQTEPRNFHLQSAPNFLDENHTPNRPHKGCTACQSNVRTPSGSRLKGNKSFSKQSTTRNKQQAFAGVSLESMCPCVQMHMQNRCSQQSSGIGYTKQQLYTSSMQSINNQPVNLRL
ncbi:hypothetical protein FGO68_gene3394 [Halteria grandinella]|uniref:Uncharacterized protein n=1 Tax=Halteria grandinella TaxID=5974 RepID=A0A8J8T0L4_HALGN|nr:hypothetical protein FGO68_gene3394 [Halteria grandinella]